MFHYLIELNKDTVAPPADACDVCASRTFKQLQSSASVDDMSEMANGICQKHLGEAWPKRPSAVVRSAPFAATAASERIGAPRTT